MPLIRVEPRINSSLGMGLPRFFMGRLVHDDHKNETVKRECIKKFKTVSERKRPGEFSDAHYAAENCSPGGELK